ncbi:MAG TPA: hypothetical protein PLO13_07050 [Anaerolineaceae bacterium]|nr:hypothetical protein [Anaerolineaceae bacterium]
MKTTSTLLNHQSIGKFSNFRLPAVEKPDFIEIDNHQTTGYGSGNHSQVIGFLFKPGANCILVSNSSLIRFPGNHRALVSAHRDNR